MGEFERGKVFESRREISNILGGDVQKGIAKSAQKPLILLFANEAALYTDYPYPKNNYDEYIYTGIGKIGDQDNVDENNMYDLNLEVMGHKKNGKKLLLFEKSNEDRYVFLGEYLLIETFQSMQPDDNQRLRRVYNFHLKVNSYKYKY